MMPGWLIAVLVIVGFIAAMIGLVFLIRARNSKTKLKYKPTLETDDVPAPAPVPEGEPVTDEFEGVNFDEPTPEQPPKVEPFNPYEDFDADFDDERRYREFIDERDRHFRAKRQLTPDEEFEKFRREHCYSKFVSDAELAKILKNAPKEIREVLLNDILKSLNLNDYNDIKI